MDDNLNAIFKDEMLSKEKLMRLKVLMQELNATSYELIFESLGMQIRVLVKKTVKKEDREKMRLR